VACSVKCRKAVQTGQYEEVSTELGRKEAAGGSTGVVTARGISRGLKHVWDMRDRVREEWSAEKF
jgi:hypothetical protein